MVNWEQLAKARLHPTQVKILEALDRETEPRSPVWLAKGLGGDIGNVSYHLRFLRKLGAVEMVRTRPVRGAVEHFYELAK